MTFYQWFRAEYEHVSPKLFENHAMYDIIEKGLREGLHPTSAAFYNLIWNAAQRKDLNLAQNYFLHCYSTSMYEKCLQNYNTLTMTIGE